MRITPIQTGSVHVRSRRRLVRDAFGGRSEQEQSAAEWLPPAPVLAYVVEHPEGLLVVDTGQAARDWETSASAADGRRVALRSNVRFEVTPDQEIGPQMERLGLPPASVRWVVLTHLHHDHVGGVKYFPYAEVLVSRVESDSPQKLLPGETPQRWPDWLAPTLVDFEPQPFGPFAASVPLTAAGDVLLLPTPGHTAGHTSVVAQDGDLACFFCGDAVFSQEYLLARALNAPAADPREARRTLDRMLALAQSRPTLFLPAHDAGAAQRLAAREPLRA